MADQHRRQRRSATDVGLADGDTVRGDLAIHRFAGGDDVCCERVKAADVSGYLSDKLRHLQQFLPETHGSVKRGDTTQGVGVPTFGVVCGPAEKVK